MQIIEHTYKNINPIFQDIESFYALTSQKYNRLPLIEIQYDKSFEQLGDLFRSETNIDLPVSYTNKVYTTVDLPVFDKKNIIVCFSGGKDSIAVVKHYMQAGYNVYLYTVKGINPISYDEADIAKEIAKYLNLPIYIEEIHLKGTHDWVEHPMKNMIIANGALNYGIREGITTKIAFGNYYTSHIWDDNFIFCGGDDIETWHAYENIIQRIIPKFRIYIWLKNLGTTLNSVCKDKELLDLSVSCIGRAGLRQNRHDWVKNKYDIDLPKHRCGQCYKCALEYIYMVDHRLQTYNKDYYQYCLMVLKRNMEKEENRKVTLLEVLRRYFFHKPKFAVDF